MNYHNTMNKCKIMLYNIVIESYIKNNYIEYTYKYIYLLTYISIFVYLNL